MKQGRRLVLLAVLSVWLQPCAHAVDHEGERLSSEKKLRAIVIPELECQDAPVSAVLGFLMDHVRKKKLAFNAILAVQVHRTHWDVIEEDDDAEEDRIDEALDDASDGVLTGDGQSTDPSVTFSGSGLTIGAIIEKVCSQTDLYQRWDGDLVVLTTHTINEQQLETRIFQVSRVGLSSANLDYTKYLADHGVKFNLHGVGGATPGLQFFGSAAKLVVSNTVDQLEAIEDAPGISRLGETSRFKHSDSHSISSKNLPNGLILTKISFDEANVSLVLDFVKGRWREWDSVSDRWGRALRPERADSPAARRESDYFVQRASYAIWADVEDAQLANLTRHICAACGLDFQLWNPGRLLVGPHLVGEDLQEKRVPLGQDLYGEILSNSRISIQEWFERFGVPFPVTHLGVAASATYDPSDETLLIANTEESIRLIEHIVLQLGTKPNLLTVDKAKPATRALPVVIVVLLVAVAFGVGVVAGQSRRRERE